MRGLSLRGSRAALEPDGGRPRRTSPPRPTTPRPPTSPQRRSPRVGFRAPALYPGTVRGVASALVAGIALVSGCASTLRERVTAFPVGTPERVPWSLNRELLMPVNRRILFVVDLAAGHPPDGRALDGLARLSARYGERPASWVVQGQAGAPAVRWQGDTLPPVDLLDAYTSYVFVAYAADQLPSWGAPYPDFVAGRTVYVILINQERHRRWRWLLPERHLEQQTLTHEYGHLLELP